MALFTISDLHLSTRTSTNKSMEVFGGRWADYLRKIEKNWRALVSDGDTVVIPGDISWALSLDEATDDLRFLDGLPGKKILGKGNHDFWWNTMKKHTEHFEKNEIKSISFLYNNAYIADDFIIAGTRGWFIDPDTKATQFPADFEKMKAREELRLKMSLLAAKELNSDCNREIIVFMHFPAVFQDTVQTGIVDILKEFSVKRVFYGHIHGNYQMPPEIMHDGIKFSIISADYLSFVPKIVRK